MSSKPTSEHRPHSGFTVAELIISVVVLAIVATVGLQMLSSIKPSVSQAKLQSEVIKLNQIAAIYMAEGGSLDGITDIQGVIDKLKTIRASADARTSTSVMTGRGVDVRLVAKSISSSEAGTSMPRAVWDDNTKTFRIATTGEVGATEFYLDDALAGHDYGTDARAATAMKYNGSNGWVWGDAAANGATNYNAANEQATTGVTDNLFDPNSVTPATQLPPPLMTPEGGAYLGAVFPSTVTIASNGAPSSGSTLKYQVTHADGTPTGWLPYTGGISISPGDIVSAQNVSTDATRFIDSAVTTATYTVDIPTLPTPVIATVGGYFPTQNFPASVTISPNGAPAGFYILQYRVINSSGAVGAWAAYGSPVPVSYGDTIEARNLTTNPNAYNTSAIASQSYMLSLAALPTPVITPPGGLFTLGTFPQSVTISSNGAPATGSELRYVVTHANGISTGWLPYTSPVSITYGDTVTAQNVSTDPTQYASSGTANESYNTATTILPTPIITPQGGMFTVDTIPTAVTISPNGAPTGRYKLQFLIVHYDGSGTLWTNYTGPVPITYGDMVLAKNASINPFYAESGIALQIYAVTPITLPTPTITPPGGSFPVGTLPTSVTIDANGAPGGTRSQLQYQITLASGGTTPWAPYTGAVPITNGDTVSARNYALIPAINTTSANATETYLLLSTFSGAVTPQWTNVGGGPGLVYTANNTNPDSVTLKHGNTQQDLGGGQVIDAGVENVMTYNRVAFSNIAANTTFNLGTLVILNGTTFNDSEATSATLHLQVGLTQPSPATSEGDLNFTMLSTANSSDRQASADQVTLTNPNTNIVTVVNGVTYSLQITLVSSDNSNGWVQGNTFYIYEGSSATATIQGKWVPN